MTFNGTGGHGHEGDRLLRRLCQPRARGRSSHVPGHWVLQPGYRALSGIQSQTGYPLMERLAEEPQSETVSVPAKRPKAQAVHAAFAHRRLDHDGH